MKTFFIRSLVLLILTMTNTVSAYEFRYRFVQRVGTVDFPICNDMLNASDGSARRIRLQIGVFDDAGGAAPAGGVIGWNVGTISVSGTTSNSDDYRTPGRLSPFNFSGSPFANGNPPLPGGDPFTSLSEIDASLGTQSPVWNGPGGPPPAVVRGRNEYVSVYEITTDPAFNFASYTITFAGNSFAATEWRTVGQPIPPDPGPDGMFGTPDDSPGFITYAPFTTAPRPFVRALQVGYSGGSSPNDMCANATSIIGPGTFSFDTSCATTDGTADAMCLSNGSSQIINDVWFTWTPNCPPGTHADLTLCSGTPPAGFNTRVAVYDGSSCVGSILTCNDDNCGGLLSRVCWTVTQSHVYKIRVGQSPGSPTSSWSFTIQCLPGPENDACECATPLLFLGNQTFDNTQATQNGPNVPLGCGAMEIDHDIWYEWKIDCGVNDLASLEFCNSPIDTKVAVYQGSSCVGGAIIVPLDCNDDSCGLQSRVCWVPQPGSTYKIRVGVPPTVSGGTGSFTLTCLPRPTVPIKIADSNTRFHRVYVFCAPDPGSSPAGQLDENLLITQDMLEIEDALELPGHQAPGSTSTVLVEPTIAEFMDAFSHLKLIAQPGDQVLLVAHGHGQTGVIALRQSEADALVGFQFRQSLGGFCNNVGVSAILYTCNGGSFANYVPPIPFYTVIGPSGTVQSDLLAPFDFLYTSFGNDISSLVRTYAADTNGDGIISSDELYIGMVARGWSLGQVSPPGVPRRGHSFCVECCGTPVVSTSSRTAAPGDVVTVTGMNFDPSVAVSIGYYNIAGTRFEIGSANTVSDGGFSVQILVPFVEGLIVATDAHGNEDWAIVYPGNGSGACCIAGSCQQLSQSGCVASGGTFQGVGIGCGYWVNCPPAPACPCDWNNSGTLNSQDFFDFIVAFFGGSADYNQDGQTTSQDFFDFLVCFFAPPVGC